jgi:DNA-binding HxlR family transcriptional regulator
MARARAHLRSRCPVNCALEIFGDPWTLLIVRDVLYVGKRRFGELLESEERIATNILADRLERLVRHGILRRVPPDEGRGGPAYEPTRKAVALVPVLLELALWSSRHDPRSAAPPAIMRRARSDREAFATMIGERVRTGLPGLPSRSRPTAGIRARAGAPAPRRSGSARPRRRA